ncbi:hypothetical protein ACJZ2D_016804 [Fusarium nematophilum]
MSSEMQQFGAHGNYGIKDQINAFLWIRKFIAGFGGDPENVTAVGESCGGVSATLLLHSREPLFRRVVSMGGHALLMAPITLEAADVAYAKVSSSLGLDNLSAKERVEKLRTIPSEEIIKKVPRSIPNRPVIDGNLFKTAVSSTDVQDARGVDCIPGKAWCDDLLIGDCQADGYIMSGGLVARKERIARQFIQSLSKSLGHQPRLAASIFSDYRISEDDEDDGAFSKIVALLTDVGFYTPTGIALQGWPCNKGRYLYHFNAPNPFPGPLQGKASHVLDVAFLFQNYNEYLSAEEVKVAKAFALAIVDFANDGKPGWMAWSQNTPENFQVFGHTADKDTTFGTEGKSQRRPFIPRLLQEYNYETLWGALQSLLRGE